MHDILSRGLTPVHFLEYLAYSGEGNGLHTVSYLHRVILPVNPTQWDTKEKGRFPVRKKSYGWLIVVLKPIQDTDETG